MKTIASHDIQTTTVQLSLNLSQLIAYLSSLDTAILKQIIRSLGAELSERQEISFSDVLKEIFSEKVSQTSPPNWDQWFAEVDEFSSVSSSLSEKSQPKPLDQLIDNLKSLLPKLQDQYRIRSLGVFGSYVRGEETETSDLDLLVDFEQDSSIGLIKICGLENYLTQQLGIQVDLTLLNELKSQPSQQILSEVVYL